MVETYILPWTLEGLNLGSDVLEVGPGPGVSTDLLRPRVPHLTCVEADRGFAEKLRRRVDPSVRVMCEDATAMSLPDQSFDAAVCFTMLHHVPSAEMQDRLLRITFHTAPCPGCAEVRVGCLAARPPWPLRMAFSSSGS